MSLYLSILEVNIFAYVYVYMHIHKDIYFKELAYTIVGAGKRVQQGRQQLGLGQGLMLQSPGQSSLSSGNSEFCS